jgi:hypothetical protein
MPPSLFDESSAMKKSGTKADLVKALTEEDTGPRRTAVIVDAMFAIRQWSFQKDDTFGSIANRYRHSLLDDVPIGTEAIHFCCDRYNTTSLKEGERQHRYAGTGLAKVYDIREQ